MTLTWFVCDLKTGQILDELPLTVGAPIERTVGAARTCSATLPVTDPSCPSNWNQLLVGGRTMIVAVNDDTPLAGYLLTSATPGDPEVPIGLTTLEGILESDYCPDLDLVDTDESQIVAALVVASIATQFGLTLNVTDCGKRSDQAYYYTEDRTVGSAVSDLMAGGGPEWMIRLSWADDAHTRFTKTLQVSAQVGSRVESVVFANEHVISRQRPRSWAPGAYANAIQATGDGAGDSRPTSSVVVDADAVAAGAPRWVDRVPVTSLDTDEALEAFAVTTLQRRRYGSQSWELEISATVPSSPVLGVDFDAGDTVTMALDATSWDPASWFGPARVIGWRASTAGRTLSQITPVFWQPSDDGSSS